MYVTGDKHKSWSKHTTQKEEVVKDGTEKENKVKKKKTDLLEKVFKYFENSIIASLLFNLSDNFSINQTRCLKNL